MRRSAAHILRHRRSIIILSILFLATGHTQSLGKTMAPGPVQEIEEEDAAAPAQGALSMEAVSKYLWRGAMMHDGPALQPGLEFTRDRWSAGLWASYNIGGGPDRTPGLSDLYPYLEYCQEVPHLEVLSVTAGFTLYTYPLLYRTPGVHRYSPEASVGFSFAIPGEPSLTFYNDFYYGSFVEVGLTFTQALFMGWTMEVELVADYSPQERHWTALMLRLTPAPNRDTPFFLNIYYQAGVSSGYDNALFFGLLITHDLF